MRKILVDIYLAYNLGDDMFLAYLAKKYPQYEFVPFHPGSNYKAFFSEYVNVKRFKYNVIDKVKARIGIDKLKDYDRMSLEFDGLLFLGGGIFREQSYWKDLHSYRIQISRSFKKNNKPIWFMGCNFGPYDTSGFIESNKNLFKIASKVHFRDTKSYSIFSDLTNTNTFPDILWDFELPNSLTTGNILGVSVINPTQKKLTKNIFTEYLNGMISVCKEHIEKGVAIKLFSFCENEGDRVIAELIKEQCPKVQIINYTGKINPFLKEISECKYFIAARFHAIIIALKYGIPLIPISYEIKTENLLYDIGYTERIISVSNITSIKSQRFFTIDKRQKEQIITEAKKHLQIEV